MDEGKKYMQLNAGKSTSVSEGFGSSGKIAKNQDISLLQDTLTYDGHNESVISIEGQSSRIQTNNDQNQRLKIDKVGQQQPSFTCNVSLAVTQNAIMDIFVKIAKQNDYSVVENDKSQALVIKRDSLTFKDFLMNCIFRKERDTQFAAIKLKIITNKLKCKRKIHIKGLRGDFDQNCAFMEAFKNYIESNKRGIYDDDDNNMHYDKAFMQSKEGNDDEDDDEDAKANPITMESAALYFFHKILADKNYGLGKKVHEFIEQFEEHNQNVKESAKTLNIAVIFILLNNYFDKYKLYASAQL